MKRLRYYIRDRFTIPACKKFPDGGKKGGPAITVVLLIENNGNIGRGVSVCSKLDNIFKEEGYRYATTRAVEALVNEGDSESFMIGKRRLKQFSKEQEPEVRTVTEVLSAFNPRLTPFELNLMQKCCTKNETIHDPMILKAGVKSMVSDETGTANIV